MSSHPIPDDQNDIDREASAWLVRVEDGGLSHDERREYEAWRAEPRHAATYDELARTWADIPELGALAELVPAPVLADTSPEPRRWRSRYAAGGFAAVAAILLAILVLPAHLFQSGDHYNTQIAETRIVTLPDGSSVTLGAKSTIAVKYTDAERRIELSGGEAFFDVVHNASRPFVVAAGGSLIRDIGTKFDVNLSTGTVRVSVLEGKVALSRTAPSPSKERLVVAGQRAEVILTVAGTPDVVATQELAVVAASPQMPGAWREGRLTYDNVRLADLVSDVNRYYAPGVELVSADVGNLRVTASFKTSEIPAFMSALSASLPVRAEPQSGGAFKVSDAR